MAARSSRHSLPDERSEMTDSSPSPPAEVAVALSGGGVRALLFGLGALRAVVAAREQLGFRFQTLAAVSGGSIAAAFASSRVDLSTATLAEYDEKVLGPAFSTVTRRSLMFGAPHLWALIALVAASIVAPIVAAVFVPGLSLGIRIAVPIAGLLVALFLLALRGWAIERSMAAVLFGDDVPLTSTPGGTRLVLQTSDLTSGEATYFTSTGVESYRWGVAPADQVSLVHAARASATFPGVFPPFRITGLRFSGGAEPDKPRTIQVVDGGVYDNMASEWLLNERRTGKAVYKVVVNASRNLHERPGSFGIPLINAEAYCFAEAEANHGTIDRFSFELRFENEANGSSIAELFSFSPSYQTTRTFAKEANWSAAQRVPPARDEPAEFDLWYEVFIIETRNFDGRLRAMWRPASSRHRL